MGYYVFEYSAGTSLFLHMATHKREASPPGASLFLFSAHKNRLLCAPSGPTACAQWNRPYCALFSVVSLFGNLFFCIFAAETKTVCPENKERRAVRGFTM